MSFRSLPHEACAKMRCNPQVDWAMRFFDANRAKNFLLCPLGERHQVVKREVERLRGSDPLHRLALLERVHRSQNRMAPHELAEGMLESRRVERPIGPGPWRSFEHDAIARRQDRPPSWLCAHNGRK